MDWALPILHTLKLGRPQGSTKEPTCLTCGYLGPRLAYTENTTFRLWLIFSLPYVYIHTYIYIRIYISLCSDGFCKEQSLDKKLAGTFPELLLTKTMSKIGAPCPQKMLCGCENNNDLENETWKSKTSKREVCHNWVLHRGLNRSTECTFAFGFLSGNRQGRSV